MQLYILRLKRGMSYLTSHPATGFTHTSTSRGAAVILYDFEVKRFARFYTTHNFKRHWVVIPIRHYHE